MARREMLPKNPMMTNSFSLSISTIPALIWWSPPLYSVLGEVWWKRRGEWRMIITLYPHTLPYPALRSTPLLLHCHYRYQAWLVQTSFQQRPSRWPMLRLTLSSFFHTPLNLPIVCRCCITALNDNLRANKFKPCGRYRYLRLAKNDGYAYRFIFICFDISI